MLKYQPSLQTERLRLRPFVAEDAPAVQQLAGAREIADTTLSIPHPYSLSAAKTWIVGHSQAFYRETSVNFALALRSSKELIGAAELHGIDTDNAQAELGFWVGTPWWGRGYATEAALAVLRYGFTELSLNRIHAHHMARNPASGRVLDKLGMKQEGVLRERARKWGVFEDVVLYAILREDAGLA